MNYNCTEKTHYFQTEGNNSCPELLKEMRKWIEKKDIIPSIISISQFDNSWIATVLYL